MITISEEMDMIYRIPDSLELCTMKYNTQNLGQLCKTYRGIDSTKLEIKKTY